MYLAQNKIKGITYYYIRESYRDGDYYSSRDLIDLGTDPASYIIYPGGNAFYIDPKIENHLEDLGVAFENSDVEDIFWRFVDPRIQRALEHFRHREARSRIPKNFKKTSKKSSLPVHIFDKRRLHYLKFGRMEQGYLWRVPKKLFDVVRNKSRDEIEQRFLEMEWQLNPREYKAYTYVIFNISRFFAESFARQRPQFLKQSDMDEYVIDEICSLNQDRTFWSGMKTGSSLHEYLIRYILMYFDYDFAPASWVDDYIRNFINSRRNYQSPFEAAAVTLEEASSIFGISREVLKKLNRQELISLFRRRAQELHPDKGGDQDKFIELTRAYDSLLRIKKD